MSCRSGITEQWHDLITDAQSASGIQLNLPVENYLINTLIYYTRQTNIAERIFAIDYMLAQHEQGQVRHTKLRDLADQCLLYAGLFPQYAKRRNVSVSYFVDIGRSAYSDLSNFRNNCSDIFAELSDKFIELMDTLLAIHNIDNKAPTDFILEPLHALQAWQQTQSQQALKIFQQQTHSSNIVDFTSKLAHKKNKH